MKQDLDCTTSLIAATSQHPDLLPTLGYDASSFTISTGWNDQMFQNLDVSVCGPITSCVLN